MSGSVLGLSYSNLTCTGKVNLTTGILGLFTAYYRWNWPFHFLLFKVRSNGFLVNFLISRILDLKARSQKASHLDVF